ncbi:MAG: hypothetical protein ACRYFK_17260 [Janthinobacterium lividum]
MFGLVRAGEHFAQQLHGGLAHLLAARPLALAPETCTLVSETIALCVKFAARRSDKLSHAMLQASCNALVALVISQYLQQAPPLDKLSRSKLLTRAFKELLASQYTTSKRPADYAQKLPISTPHLNACVKEITGYSVFHPRRRAVALLSPFN